MSFEVTSFYLRVEMNWDYRNTDEEGNEYPLIDVQDDGLHTLPVALLEKVGQLIEAALSGNGRATHGSRVIALRELPEPSP